MINLNELEAVLEFANLNETEKTDLVDSAKELTLFVQHVSRENNISEEAANVRFQIYAEQPAIKSKVNSDEIVDRILTEFPDINEEEIESKFLEILVDILSDIAQEYAEVEKYSINIKSAMKKALTVLFKLQRSL